MIGPLTRKQAKQRDKFYSKIEQVKRSRNKITADMRPLFDHLIYLAEDDYSSNVGYRKVRAGRDLAKAAKFAKKYPKKRKKRRSIPLHLKALARRRR